MFIYNNMNSSYKMLINQYFFLIGLIKKINYCSTLLSLKKNK